MSGGFSCKLRVNISWILSSTSYGMLSVTSPDYPFPETAFTDIGYIKKLKDYAYLKHHCIVMTIVYFRGTSYSPIHFLFSLFSVLTYISENIVLKSFLNLTSRINCFLLSGRVWKYEDEVLAQMSSSLSVWNLKLRDPFQNSPRIALKLDFDMTKQSSGHYCSLCTDAKTTVLPT